MFLSANNSNIDADYIILDRDTVLGKTWAIAQWAGEEISNYSGVYYISRDNLLKPVYLFYPEYYESLMVRLYNFDGKAVIPTQSTVINLKLDFPFTSEGRVLQSIDVYGTYDEAIKNLGIGRRLVGTGVLKVDGYSLVYEASEKVDGISYVKIFRKE